MSIVASRPAVGTAASLIASNTTSDASEGDYRSKRYLLKNVTLTAPVFLGASAVTTAAGFQWDPEDGPLSFELEPGESLYGIVAALPQAVHVLAQGR